MGHELGHGVAKHAYETRSWQELINWSVYGRLVLLGGLSVFPAVAAGYMLSSLAKAVCIDTFLTQQQEYEADVLSAVISRAAVVRRMLWMW